MKLIHEYQMEEEPVLWGITEACYTGVALPLREDFERFLNHGDVFVRYEDNEIASYALVSSLLVGGGSDCPAPAPLLRSIATKPKYRTHGHAGCLLTEIRDYYTAQGAPQIVLHCHVDNPAQTLYFKAGYRVTAVLRGFYKPEGNGLEMRKTL